MTSKGPVKDTERTRKGHGRDHKGGQQRTGKDLDGSGKDREGTGMNQERTSKGHGKDQERIRE